MKRFVNYLGQLRVYSLVDLVLLVAVVSSDWWQGMGAICLWVGFLLFLEARHKHSYRAEFPKFLWGAFYLVGLVLYRHPEGYIFVLLTYIYTLKTRAWFGSISPLVRGLQNFVLGAGIVGYYNPITWLAFALTVLRNFLGDVRDVAKDREEGMRTLPVLLGLKRGSQYIHLYGVMATSAVWWSFSELHWGILLLIWLIQITTYNLTPR